MAANPGRLAALLFACLLGCATAAAPGKPSPDDVISREQLQQARFRTAYDAIQALHASWLLTRGNDTLAEQNEVIVYLDTAPMGGIPALRGIPISQVQYIRHFDGNAATQRWGANHGQGAILVSTRPL